MNRCALLFGFILLVVGHSGFGQGFPQSPEVHADGRVTFRLPAPNAEKVVVRGGVFGRDGLAMVKGDRGLWEGTSEVLEAGIYDYTFDVDGAVVMDPHNREVKAWRRMANMVLVPGDPARAWEVQDVAHGEVHLLRYKSETLGGVQREMRVYTPAGYAESGERVYPVLYLLHGSGDDASAWTVVGKADVIADNLIAAGKAEPTVIVMPHGHASYAEGREGHRREAFYEDFLKEVVPLVEGRFRVKKDRLGKAVAGLSMGGGQSTWIGMTASGDFGWVGAFSAAVPGDEGGAEALWEGTKYEPSELFWIACGRDDFLLERNQFFHRWLLEKGVKHSYLETDGGHSWDVWRGYLERFLPLLFREEGTVRWEIELPRPQWVGRGLSGEEHEDLAPRELWGKSFNEEVRLPEGVENVAAGKRVTAGGEVDGDLGMVTDGDRRDSENQLDLGDSAGWVQVDLEEEMEVFGCVWWQDFRREGFYEDVVLEVSDDAGFEDGVVTIFNNDRDGSAGRGKGADWIFPERNHGMRVWCRGVRGRYVRLWSGGSGMWDTNRVVELEVYGRKVE